MSFFQNRIVQSLVAVCASLLFATLLLEYLAWRGPHLRAGLDSGPDIRFEREGTIVVVGSRNRVQSGRVLVPANEPWTDSHLDLDPGAVARIEATGRIHLAIHAVVDSAKQDTVLALPWSTPDGYPYQLRPEKAEKDRLRRELLLRPDIPIGALVLYLQTSRDAPPNVMTNPRPQGIRLVGSATTIANREAEPARIWFGINDMLLEDTNEARTAYLGPASGEAEPQDAKRWAGIVQAQRWTHWFDDNVGYYFANVAFEEH